MDKAVAVKLQPAGLSIIFEKISPAPAKHLSDKLHAMQALAHSQEQHSITYKLKSSGWLAAKKACPNYNSSKRQAAIVVPERHEGAN